MNMQASITAQQVLIAANDLRNATAMFQRVIEQRATIPVLNTIKISGKAGSQSVTMDGTDLDMHLRLRIDAEVARDFNSAVPFKALAAFANGATGPIGLNVIDDILTVTADDLTAHLRLLSPANDFPPFAGEKDLKAGHRTSISEPDLHRLFNLGQHCISNEATRYYLNGAFLTKNPETGMLRSVTTDGHRLGVIDTEVPASDAPDTIIHRKVVAAALAYTNPKGNQSVSITRTERWTQFSWEGVLLFAKNIDGTYPDYTRVIPSKAPTTRCAVTKSSVSRLACIAKAMNQLDRFVTVKLDPTEGRMSTTQIDGDGASVPLQSEGEIITGFNLHYLAEQMKATPEASIEYASSDEPARIKGEDPHAFWLLMPRRLDER